MTRKVDPSEQPSQQKAPWCQCPGPSHRTRRGSQQQSRSGCRPARSSVQTAEPRQRWEPSCSPQRTQQTQWNLMGKVEQRWSGQMFSDWVNVLAQGKGLLLPGSLSLSAMALREATSSSWGAWITITVDPRMLSKQPTFPCMFSLSLRK